MDYSTYNDAVDKVTSKFKYRGFNIQGLDNNTLPFQPELFNSATWIVIAIIIFVFIVFFVLLISKRDIKNVKSDVASHNLFQNTTITLKEMAERHEKAKDYNKALCALFVYTIGILYENNIIRKEENKTNYQIYKNLRSISFREHKPFGHMAMSFDYAYYGKRPIEEYEYNTFKTHYNSVIREVKSIAK